MRQLSFRNCLVVLLLVATGFAIYGNSFGNQMFWDDNDSILNNQYIKDWQYFPRYFSENLIAGAGLLSNYWRPVLLSVFSLEWHLWQGWTAGYHFVSTSFHIANAVLLFFILLYVFKNRWLSALAALVFLVHPLQTEVITFAAGLADPLSVFFIFLGIFFYLRFKGALHFLSLLMFVFALMSKETAIIMPGLIFIIDFIGLKKKLKPSLKSILPFLIMAAVYIALRATVLNFQNTFNLYNEENIFTSNFHIRLFTFFRVLVVYFGLLFRPFNLHMERAVEMAASLLSPSVIFGTFIFFGLLVLAFAKFRRLPILSFGILWFFIGLSPTSNLLVPVNSLLYEHWLYLPLIGVFLPLIWLGMLAAKKYNLPKLLFGIFIVFLVFLSILTVNRNKDWKDPITLYNQTLKYAPTSYRVLNNLGMAYADNGQQELAEKTFKKAINSNPSAPVAYHNLGNTFRATGRIDLAIESFKTAIQLDPKFIFSYNALADVFLRNKNYPEARKVLESSPDYGNSKVDTLVLLSQIAVREKDFNAALNYLEKAMLVDPGNQSIRKSIIDILEARQP